MIAGGNFAITTETTMREDLNRATRMFSLRARAELENYRNSCAPPSLGDLDKAVPGFAHLYHSSVDGAYVHGMRVATSFLVAMFNIDPKNAFHGECIHMAVIRNLHNAVGSFTEDVILEIQDRDRRMHERAGEGHHQQVVTDAIEKARGK